MPQDHLPPGIEEKAHEAILALIKCNGLAPAHLQTIQFCIAVCPPSFERAYRAYSDSLGALDLCSADTDGLRVLQYVG